MNEDDLAPEEQQEAPPPRKLTSDPNLPHYHPGCLRVGVRINGQERRDIIAYDMDKREALTQRKQLLQLVEIETYWRWPEARQERRARERWEKKHPQ